MAPYFSVILPVYNVAVYLERCIRSVLDQSFRDYELILVDDGATDTSPAICDEFAARYDNVRVIHKPNGGLSSARNAGLEIAQGRYIWWVDSDDFIEPGALEMLYESSRDAQPDMVKFDYYRVETSAQAIRSNAEPGCYSGQAVRQELLKKAFFTSGKYGLSAWSHLYRREFLEKTGLRFVSERIIGSEDYLFNLEATYAAKSLVVLSAPLYDYELRSGSLTQQYKKDLAERYGKLAAALREWYRNADAPACYLGKINSFYLWHLIHGTCMPHEYTPVKGHTLAEGRGNVRRLLGQLQVRQALKDFDRSGFTYKQQLQLAAMRLKLEILFYWLYVVKPGRKEKKHYENQN